MRAVQRFGVTVACLLGLVVGMSLLPTAKAGSVMAGVQHVIAPTMHAQYAYLGGCLAMFDQIDTLNAQGWTFVLGYAEDLGAFMFGLELYRVHWSMFPPPFTGQQFEQDVTIDCLGQWW